MMKILPFIYWHIIPSILRSVTLKAYHGLIAITIIPSLPLYDITRQRGWDIARDIKRYIPSLDIEVIFDVGAHVGQSTERYLRKFNKATVYSFEPEQSNYEALLKRFTRNKRVKIFQIAISNVVADDYLFCKEGATNNMLCKLSNEIIEVEYSEYDKKLVKLETIDDFCKRNNITHIDFLKIDTEGGDLDVLKGAYGMLINHKINIIQVEAAMNPSNHQHKQFEEMKYYLEQLDYYLFAFYEQVGEIVNNEILRRVDATFTLYK